MDAAVAAGWIGGIAGLVGAVLGAGVSVWATRVSQREQARQNREALEFQAAENRRSMEFQAAETRRSMEFQAQQHRETLEIQETHHREVRDFQRQEARELRLSEVDAAATDIALSELSHVEAEVATSHLILQMFATDRLPWEETVQEHLRLTQLAVARIPNRAVEARVLVALDLCRQYRAAEQYQLGWTLWVQGLTRDMINVLSAHRRGEAEVPPEGDVVSHARDSLARTRARAQEEERRRHGQHDR